MYKHNYSFFDPNIWHLDDELRKQVESFARCFILTGQEAPETNKKMHIDLYKKTISGDGIYGQKAVWIQCTNVPNDRLDHTVWGSRASEAEKPWDSLGYRCSLP